MEFRSEGRGGLELPADGQLARLGKQRGVTLHPTQGLVLGKESTGQGDFEEEAQDRTSFEPAGHI